MGWEHKSSLGLRCLFPLFLAASCLAWSVSAHAAEGKAEEELFTVPSWIQQTREGLLGHTRFVAGFVYDWPGPLSKYAERGAFCCFQGYLREMISRLVWVILRLNAVEAIPFHELDETFSSLPVQPRNAYTRILEILYCANPADTLAPLEALAREVETIVQAREP